MNIKTNLVKPMCTALGVMGMLTAAYAFSPAKEQSVAPLVERIEVTAPFKLESINVKKSFAAVETLNEQYVVEFEYVAEFSNHNNGVGGSWNEVDVLEIKEPRVYDENGEVENYYLDSRSVQEIVHVIEQELRERV
ncbi:hypothetical protein EXE30_06710 [Acinetobacter halotolerans]|uniref:Uncharacterized protein n=1 Tax=Acinetobacter halotolerans TaxID=1752076 RepID=A0A4Q6XCE9_9GAMM|nr:hypothetical protein [Acinetobacter halotolerans]RZF53660.1 hypothetical protein EXE30_06710 [Acinetobacter halotolerans]